MTLDVPKEHTYTWVYFVKIIIQRSKTKNPLKLILAIKIIIALTLIILLELNDIIIKFFRQIITAIIITTLVVYVKIESVNINQKSIEIEWFFRCLQKLEQ